MQYQKLVGVLGYNKESQLTLTDKRLVFKAHALNIGQKEYIVQLQDIKFAQNTFHALTPTPNMIKVELQSGEVYKFVVKGKEKDTWRNLVLEYAQKARSQVDVEITGTENIRFCKKCGERILMGAQFCAKCGKQIEDNSKFCPYCGGGLSTSDTGSAKEALKKTAGAVMNSAKAIGNSVNDNVI